MELTTQIENINADTQLFMMSKIQNLNGTHNNEEGMKKFEKVVYDVKDTKFEWNSQHRLHFCYK